MKGAISIFKRDLKNIFENYGGILVIVALCILPSLYAWFNIKACWDPYSAEATGGIKVGIINEDTGTTLNGRDINLGNDVVDELRQNSQLGWQFVNKEEASKMLNEGKYYATITIPSEFSKDLTSILTNNVQKADIIYTVNEKINAIAPKMTDKGASSIKEKISKTIVQTVSDAIFGMGNELGIELENQIPKIQTIYNSLLDMQGHFGNMNDFIELTSKGAEQLKTLIVGIQQDIPIIEQTVQNAQGLSDQVKSFISTSKDSLSNIAPVIKNDINLLNQISNEISTTTSSIIDAINSGSENAPAMIDSLLDKLNSISKSVDSLIGILQNMNKLSPGKFDDIIYTLQTVKGDISSAITALNIVKDNVINGQGPDLSILNNIIALSNDVSTITNNLYNNFDTNIAGNINSIFDSAYIVADNASVVLSEAQENLPQVSDLLNTVYQGADKGIEGLEYVKEKLPEAENMINDLVSKIGVINNSNDLQQVVDLLKSDVKQRSDFLSNPVNLVEKDLFSMGNYGSAMTPFYTVLSLWVGLLLLTSMLTVEVEGEFTATQQYFGKLFLFLSIAIIQSLIVSLGDLYLLKIYCTNPIEFVLGTVFTSFIFTFIVYSLVSVLGNVGKVLAIVLLVLQIGGSGGTYPIQVTPKFFQGINPFLPFTYAISLGREAIGGIVKNSIIKDTIVLIIFALIFMLVALFLKKPINNLLHGFNESFKKTGIGEER